MELPPVSRGQQVSGPLRDDNSDFANAVKNIMSELETLKTKVSTWHTYFITGMPGKEVEKAREAVESQMDKMGGDVDTLNGLCDGPNTTARIWEAYHPFHTAWTNLASVVHATNPNPTGVLKEWKALGPSLQDTQNAWNSQ